MSTNITWHEGSVSLTERQQLLNQKVSSFFTREKKRGEILKTKSRVSLFGLLVFQLPVSLL